MLKYRCLALKEQEKSARKLKRKIQKNRIGHRGRINTFQQKTIK